MNMKTTEQVFKDIQAGKYRDHYLTYGRRSTDDPNIQKNSLKYQRTENTRFAFREKLPLAALSLDGFCKDGVISERHSAFKEDTALTFEEGMVQYRVERPKFYSLAEFLSKGYFKGAIFLCWDRASRNKGDDTILRKLMKSGADIRFAFAQYDKTSSGELHMDIDGMFSEHHSRVTREKVTLTIHSARSRGLTTNKAPVGYLNEGNMDWKPKDPVRAPIILELAKLANTGEWSLHDLARWAIEQGFTMPPMRRRRTKEEMLMEEEDDVRVEIEQISRLPTYNTIHKILTNRYYTGKTMDENGEWIPSTSHEAIIPEDLFNRVQERLAKRNKSVHYLEVLEHPLRGFAFCGVCGRVYTPYPKKGTMYYGARCSRECANPLKSFNFDFLTDKAGELIAKLSFTEQELVEIDARANTDIALLEAKRMSQLEAQERKKKNIREELAYLNGNRIPLLKAGVYTPETFVAEEARLSAELAKLCEAEITSDVAMRETIKDVVLLSELLKNAAVIYSEAEPHEKDKILRVIFSELTFNENALDYKCKKGFAALQSRFVASCDPTGNRTPLSTVRGSRPSR
jgi:site-specific DNA recombinase